MPCCSGNLRVKVWHVEWKKKMKFIKLLFFLTGAIVITLACGVGNDLSITQPVNVPIETLIVPSSIIPRLAHAPTLTPVFLSPTPRSFLYPAWVADFSDPILVAVNDQRPVFADDFPSICIDEYKKWKVCSTPEQRTYYQSNESDPFSISELPLATARATLDLQPDLQNGYTLLNTGWFYLVSDNPKKPFYAQIDNGALVLSLPNGNEKNDFWVYSQHFLQKNFVIQFDIEFDESQQNDTFRFQFKQGMAESFALDLAKNKIWDFRWGSPDNLQSRSGDYEYFPRGLTRVLIIARGNQCAVYLNNVPLDYFENCRTDANIKPSMQSTTFHLLAEPGHPAVLTIDNVKMWDLDKISVFSTPP
jgi:hypothetical protein